MNTQSPSDVGPFAKCFMILGGIAFPIVLVAGIILVWPPPEDQDKLEQALLKVAHVLKNRNNGATAAEKTAAEKTAAEKAAAEKAAAKRKAATNPKNGSKLHIETRLILLVILVGALGSYIGLATSFVGYVGNQKLRRSWLPWYVLRPFTGSALPLLFYFTVRGGFVSATSDGTDVNLFGILAVAGLAGLFSKHATKKLEEVFKNTFKVDDDPDKPLQDPLGGGDSPPAPVICSIAPNTTSAGTAVADVTITGANFADSAKVQFGDKEIQPKQSSATELKFDLAATDIPDPGPIDVKVVNPDDQGGASDAKTFTVT